MLVHWSQGQNHDLLTHSERLNSDQAVLFWECYRCRFVWKTMVGSSRHYHMKNLLWMIFVVLPGLVIIFSSTLLNSYVVVILRVWWQS